MNIKLAQDEKIKVFSGSDLYPIMQRILLNESKTDRNREHFWTVSLDNAHRILNIELVSMGTVNATLVQPMEVLSIPLQKRAVKLILIHNHPSGELVPSDADKDQTDHLIQACLIMDVPVVDHMIITETSFYSFRDSGLLGKLEKSEKYVPNYILKQRYEKEMEKYAEKKGEKNRAREIARTMKQKGLDIELIMEMTGLAKATIVNLKVEK
jgi:DNA repair protein RadC